MIVASLRSIFAMLGLGSAGTQIIELLVQRLYLLFLEHLHLHHHVKCWLPV